MQVDYQQIDPLNARMSVTIAREDYEPKYKESLREYRKKANLKGFRKGKIPVGYLEKVFGQEALTRTVTDMLTNAVNTYMEEHEIPYIGQPLPAKDQSPLHFDPKALEEAYSYRFDIGLLPEFEIKGIDEEIEWFDIPVKEEEIEKEWQELLNRQGSYVDAETVTDDCRVNMRFVEMEGSEPKPEGREHTRMIYIQMLKDEIRDQLLGKKVGATVRFSPDVFLKEGDKQTFQRYYFEIKDDEEPLAEQIEGHVLGISVLKPAEPNEEFFTTAFEPGTVKSEEEAREMISKALKQRNDAQSDAHLRHMIEHRLIDDNQFDLPLAFLDRLTAPQEEGHADHDHTPTSASEISEDVTVDVIEGNDEPAAEATEEEDTTTTPESGEHVHGEEAPSEQRANGFRWHFIKEKLAKKYQLEASQDEIVRAAADHVYNQFGGYLPYDRMRELVTRYLSDKDSVTQLRNSVIDTKLFHTLKEEMPVVKKEISREDFSKLQEEHAHAH